MCVSKKGIIVASKYRKMSILVYRLKYPHTLTLDNLK